MQDMTRGSITRDIIKYSIPLIIGNVMQLTYNAADSVIIGKALGEKALAAVSTSNPIMTIMVLGASGIGIGSSVIMSNFYGAKDHRNLRREFSTTVIFSTIFSLLVFVLGMIFSRHFLTWINCPANSLGMATTYLRIIFVGFLFTFQYNILSYSMRSIGDTKPPVYFLGVSCVINIVLDILFVLVLDMKVVGAGVATVISQAVSAVLCAVWIYKKIPELKLRRKDFVVDKELLSKTVKSGALTALQQTALPGGKVLIQGVVNAQGITAIGAFNAVCRVDDFACIPSQSIGSGIMTCAAQNMGAGVKERVKKSFLSGLIITACYFPIICIIAFLFKLPIMQALCPDESITMIEMGVEYLSVKAWMFVLPCVMNAFQGFFRGVGKMNIVLIATVLQMTIRTVCAYLWVPVIGITGEAFASLAGWIIMLGFEGICLFFEMRRINRVMK